MSPQGISWPAFLDRLPGLAAAAASALFLGPAMAGASPIPRFGDDVPFPSAAPTTGPVGAESNPTGNPIGGGPGYSDILDPSQAHYVVTNRAELLFALGDARTNVKDSWGHNNGTIHGAAWVDGRIGKGLRFDGVDDYVDIANHQSLNLTGVATIEMWARFDALTANEEPLDNNLYRVLHRGDWAGDRVYFLYRIAENAAPGESAWTRWAAVRTETPVVTGQWAHIVGVKDGTRLRIYLNGVLEKDLDCLTGYTVDGSQTGSLYLGQNPFGGMLDEVRVYSRPLTATEVQQNYAGASVVTSGLVSWWRFEDDPAVTRKVVYVADDAEIDLTGERGIAIPESVTLASGRGRNGSPGGLLFTDQHSADVDPLFRAAGPGVRLTGLRLRGPDPEIGDHHYGPDYFLSGGVSSRFPSFEVDNSELSGWSHGAVVVDRGATGAYVHHNHIHHNRRAGLGYGVVLGWANASEPIGATIEANLFDFCRHHIASTGSPYSSYEARYNIALEHANSHAFDRHGTETPGTWWGGDAGDWTIIHHNTARVTDNRSVAVRGKPVLGALIHDNWFYQRDLDSAILLFTTTNVTIGDNHYGVTSPAGTQLPVARITAVPPFGRVPLTVSFDGSSSHDPDGTLRTHEWDFGDGNAASGAQVVHTFGAAGAYNVTLTVSDDSGIPARARVPVTVAPASVSYVLDLWVADSYRGSLAGYYRKQVLIDGTVVWEDDVAGDEGWTHVVTDVTAHVAGKNEIALALRTYCTTAVTDPDNQIIEVFAYWDDVHLAGGSVPNGDMEVPGGWTYSESGDSTWGGANQSGDVRSGDRAYALYHPYRTNSVAGSWSQLGQVVAVLPSTLRVQWSFDEIAGNLVADASMYANHGTLVNMGAGSWVDGILGRALRFDGVDDYVDGGSDGSLTSAVGSLEFWIKPEAAGPMDILRLFEDDDQNYLLVAKGSSDRVRVVVKDGGATRVDITSNSAISTASYHHVAITQAGTGIAVFVDGQQSAVVGPNSDSWTAHLAVGRLQIGRGNHGYFKGVLDDLAIHSRALTAEEIRQHNDQGYPRGAWRLNEGAGNTTADSSTYGNHGTLVNMSPSSWVDGVSGKALRFDGVDDRVAVNVHPSLNVTGPLTIEMWTRFDTLVQHENVLDNNLYRIYHRGDWAGDRVYFLYRIAESASSGDSAWTYWAGVRTEREVLAGQWAHIVAVRDGNRMAIYLNGVLEKELGCLSGYTVHASQGGSLYLGRDPFAGVLDEITLHARALSAAEVRQRYDRIFASGFE